MQINNRSIQDMYIFGDPLRNPVILVERVMNAPFRTRSGNSYFTPLGQKDTASILMGTRVTGGNQLSGTGTPRNSRILRIVVFVHGFQVYIFVVLSGYIFVRTSLLFLVILCWSLGKLVTSSVSENSSVHCLVYITFSPSYA